MEHKINDIIVQNTSLIPEKSKAIINRFCKHVMQYGESQRLKVHELSGLEFKQT